MIITLSRGFYIQTLSYQRYSLEIYLADLYEILFFLYEHKTFYKRKKIKKNVIIIFLMKARYAPRGIKKTPNIEKFHILDCKLQDLF